MFKAKPRKTKQKDNPIYSLFPKFSKEEGGEIDVSRKDLFECELSLLKSVPWYKIKPKSSNKLGRLWRNRFFVEFFVVRNKNRCCCCCCCRDGCCCRCCLIDVNYFFDNFDGFIGFAAERIQSFLVDMGAKAEHLTFVRKWNCLGATLPFQSHLHWPTLRLFCYDEQLSQRYKTSC